MKDVMKIKATALICLLIVCINCSNNESKSNQLVKNIPVVKNGKESILNIYDLNGLKVLLKKGC